MKKIVLLLVLFFYNSVFSQRVSSIGKDRYYIDSLATVVKTTKNDSIRSLCSFELVAQYLKANEIEKAEKYLAIGNKYSDKFQYLRDCSGYFNALKLLHSNQLDSFAVQIAKTQKRLLKHEFQRSYKLQSIILQNLSIYHQIKGNKKEATRILIEEAIPVGVKAGNKIMLSNLYNMIATNLVNISDRKKANEYYLKSLKLLEDLKDKDPFLTETLITINIATGENLLHLNKISEGRNLLDNALLLLKKYPKSNLNYLYIPANGLYFHKIKNFNMALQCYDRGLQTIQGAEDFDIRDLNKIKQQKAETLFELKKYAEAKIIIKDLLKNGELNPSEKNISRLKLSKILEKTEDYHNAYYQLKKYTEVNDSIVAGNTKNEILFLESKFKNKENESKIKELSFQKNNAELKSKNDRLKYIFFATTSIALLLLIIFILLYQRKKSQLVKERELKSAHQIDSLKKRREVELMQAMIKGEESERKRIARDLHDSIGSKLSALKIVFSTLENKIDNNKTSQIDSILDTSITELRQISYNLVPESLLQLGLENALSDLCYTLQAASVNIEFHAIEIKDDLSVSTQLNIFRIVQEILNNALKHSFCTQILITCSQNSNRFYITIEDNGIGFTVSNREGTEGLGLKNIKTRIELLNGKWDFESNSKGTSYNIEFEV